MRRSAVDWEPQACCTQTLCLHWGACCLWILSLLRFLCQKSSSCFPQGTHLGTSVLRTKMHTESITSKLSGQKNTMLLSSCQSTAPKCKLRHWGRSPHHPAKLREAWARGRNHFTHQPMFKGFEFEKWNKTNYPNKNRMMMTWPLNKVWGYAPFPPIRHVFPWLCEYFS